MKDKNVRKYIIKLESLGIRKNSDGEWERNPDADREKVAEAQELLAQVKGIIAANACNHKLYKALTRKGVYPKYFADDIAQDAVLELLNDIHKDGIFVGNPFNLCTHISCMRIYKDYKNFKKAERAAQNTLEKLSKANKNNKDYSTIQIDSLKYYFYKFLDKHRDILIHEDDFFILYAYIWSTNEEKSLGDTKNGKPLLEIVWRNLCNINYKCHIHEMTFFEAINQTEIHTMLGSGHTVENVRQINHVLRKKAHDYYLSFNESNINEADYGVQRLQDLTDSYSKRIGSEYKGIHPRSGSTV